MTMRRIILATAALALTPVAAAQKIASAEAGVAPLSFAGFAPSAATVTVNPGDIARTEQVYPANAVGLLDPAKPGGRPGADGLPAGALLFGYQLSTGMAYCPPLNPEKSFKRAPRFRLRLDNETLENEHACEIPQPGACRVTGVRLNFQRPSRARLRSASKAPPRIETSTS